MKEQGKCYACGGMVDAHGMAMGGEVEPDGDADDAVNGDGQKTQDAQADDDGAAARRAFVRAVKGGR